MNLFVNGVTLLAATAPALAALLEEAKGVISFDRCHHLVLENADALLNDHYKPMKKLVEFYRQSVDRVNANSSKGYFVPRQARTTLALILQRFKQDVPSFKTIRS